MPTHLYTWLRENWDCVGCSRIFQSHLVHTLVHKTSVGSSRLFFSFKEPCKVPESSIGAYK